VGGTLAAVIGLLGLPLGYGVSPKRDLSVFYNLTDMGVFIEAAFVLILFGLSALVVSCFLPGNLDE
jgi:hypothetical protein